MASAERPFQGIIVRPIRGRPSELMNRVMGSLLSLQSPPTETNSRHNQRNKTRSPRMLSMSTISVEARGTPERATRGCTDLGKGGREGFDDKQPCQLLRLRWFGWEGPLKCTTCPPWRVTVFHGLHGFKRLKPSQMYLYASPYLQMLDIALHLLHFGRRCLRRRLFDPQ